MSLFQYLCCTALRLGASASQVGPQGGGKEGLTHLLAIVGKLHQQLEKEVSEEELDEAYHKAKCPAVPPIEDAPAASAAGLEADIDGEPMDEDEEQESQADAESVKEVETEHEKAKQQALLKPKPVATPARADFRPEDVLRRLRSTVSESSSLPTTAVMSPAPRPETPPASMPCAVADQPLPPAPVINSTTHKREYMRLVPWL